MRKLLDPCFHNVWNKEQQALNKKRLSKDIEVVIENESFNLFQGQEKVSTTAADPNRDGINLDVENADTEELDYVDDVIDDGELSDIDDSMVEEILQDKEENIQVTSSQQPHQPSTSATLNLTDEQLATHPRVRSLFDQFWNEKMKEIDRNREGKNTKDRNKSGNKNKHKNLGNIGNPAVNMLIKSPSDTTIYV